MKKICELLFVVLLFTAASAFASPITVSSIGDKGWYSDDTRSATGADLVGSTLTRYGKPGQTATAADDATIAQMISVVAASATPTDASGYVSDGALKLSKTSTGGGYSKATLSAVSTSGFASSTATSSWADGFSAKYAYYTNSTAETACLKIGVQSTAWSASQSGFTALRSGESAWDLVLVNWDATPAANVWTTADLNADSKIWYVYKQSGNGAMVSLTGTKYSINQLKTLTTTVGAVTYDWDALLFGDGAKVSSVQLGLGSSTANSTSYVDYLQTSVYNGGDVVNFAVPEPTTLAVLCVGAAVGLLSLRKRSAKLATALTMVAVLGIGASAQAATLTLVGADAPNIYSSATSYSAWWANALAAVMSDQTTLGTGNAQYVQLSATGGESDIRPVYEALATGFASWQGVAGGTNEYGHRSSFIYHISASAGETLSLANISAESVTMDGHGYDNYLYALTPPTTLDAAKRVAYAADGTAVTAGTIEAWDAAHSDNLITDVVGVFGMAFAAYSQSGYTDQEVLDASLAGMADLNYFTGSLTYGGVTAETTLRFSAVPEPTTWATLALVGCAVAWRRIARRK